MGLTGYGYIDTPFASESLELRDKVVYLRADGFCAVLCLPRNASRLGRQP